MHPWARSKPAPWTPLRTVEHHFLFVDEKNNVSALFTVAGFNFAGAGQNSGIGFIKLKGWDVRKGSANRAPEIVKRAMAALFRACAMRRFSSWCRRPCWNWATRPGSTWSWRIAEGSATTSFLAARNQLLALAQANPDLVAVRPNGLEDTPQVHVDVDTVHAAALGVNQADINITLSNIWGATYIGDFVDKARVKHVYMEGDAPFRSKPDDLFIWNVRNASGSMTPFSAFSKVSWIYGPAQLTRYNGVPSLEIQGQAAPGKSSGAAMSAVEKMVARLPLGVGSEWTGLSLQEKAAGSQAPLLYGLSILVVFLCLAALYARAGRSRWR